MKLSWQQQHPFFQICGITIDILLKIDCLMVHTVCLVFQVSTIDIESLQNRSLKVYYVPATSTSLNRLLFAAAINSTNEANKAGGTHS